jgi:hypothetical protein
MASMQGRFRPLHKPKPHMLAGALALICTCHNEPYIKMKYLFLTLLILISFESIAQFGHYKFKIISRLNTEVEISVSVYYRGDHYFKESDSELQEVKKLIIDSLKRFDVFEMYGSERNTIDLIIGEIFKNYFEGKNVIVDKAILISVRIPEEAKILYYRFLELQQKYLEVYLKIHERNEALKSELKTNLDLTESERIEIKREISVLENYKYISRIYHRNLDSLIMKN